jgi:elongation factor 1-beta
MGSVAVTFKIMPDSPDTNLEEIKKEISKKIEIKDSKIEPVAFGLKILRVLVVVPDKSIENIENDLRSVDGVSEVEVESSTLI